MRNTLINLIKLFYYKIIPNLSIRKGLNTKNINFTFPKCPANYRSYKPHVIYFSYGDIPFA